MLLLFIDFLMSGGSWRSHLCFGRFSSVNRLQEFFQRLIFTLIEKLNNKLQGISIPMQCCLQWCLQPITSMNIFCNMRETKFCKYSTREVNRQLFCVFNQFHSKFIDCIITPLFCIKLFSCCWFSDTFIDVVSPNNWILSKVLHVCSPVLWCPDSSPH